MKKLINKEILYLVYCFPKELIYETTDLREAMNFADYKANNNLCHHSYRIVCDGVVIYQVFCKEFII